DLEFATSASSHGQAKFHSVQCAPWASEGNGVLNPPIAPSTIAPKPIANARNDSHSVCVSLAGVEPNSRSQLRVARLWPPPTIRLLCCASRCSRCSRSHCFLRSGSLYGIANPYSFPFLLDVSPQWRKNFLIPRMGSAPSRPHFFQCTRGHPTNSNQLLQGHPSQCRQYFCLPGITARVGIFCVNALCRVDETGFNFH